MSKKEDLHKKYLEHDLCNGIHYDIYQYVFYIENQNNLLLNALKEFVNRVEKGEVKSKKTYSKFKEIISECE